MTLLPRRTAAALAAVALVATVGCSDAEPEAEPSTSVTEADELPQFGIDPAAPPPTQSVVLDLRDGTGPPVEDGDFVEVTYVGRGWRSGVPFGSWESPPLQFRIGDGSVIDGFAAGIVGMSRGGRRQIILPADQGYPDADLGALNGDALVFVVELVATRS